MSSNSPAQGEDSLRGSDRERRTLEQRLRAALLQDVELIELEEEAEPPLALTNPVAPEPETDAPTGLDADPEAEPDSPPDADPEADAEGDPEPEPVATPTDEAVAIQEDPEPEAPAPVPSPSIWNRLPRIPVEPARLERNLVITANRRDPYSAAFDVLRTKIVQAMQEKGWSRVGITSAQSGSGKSFTALNLTISLSRLRNFRTILLDLDLRRPGLANMLGLRDMPATADFLRGEIAAEDYLSVFAPNLLNIGDRAALGINGREEPYASELLQNPDTAARIDALKADFEADILLFDLPPALAMDDVLAFRPYLDCVLVVVGGGETRTRDIRELRNRLGDDLPILGVVLNKAELDGDPAYSYGY